MVNIRNSPDLNSPSPVSKPVGTRVTVTDKTGKDTSGFAWYRVTFDGTKDGWVRDDVIDLSATPSPSPSPKPTPTPTPDDLAVRTRLFFETNTRSVRVFEEGTSVFMNIYNKNTASTELNHVFATKLPSSRGWENYLSTKDGRAYQASMIRRGATQLKITNSATGLDVEPIESGFKSWGTEYQ